MKTEEILMRAAEYRLVREALGTYVIDLAVPCPIGDTRPEISEAQAGRGSCERTDGRAAAGTAHPEACPRIAAKSQAPREAGGML